MGIALKLQQYLDDQNAHYEVQTHKRTSSSLETAEASHVPGDCLAKGVVLTRANGYVMAVLPACRKLRLDAIQQILNCQVAMATEDQIGTLFPDCNIGAIPPIGAAYGLEAIIDDSLDQPAEIYLEAGDHLSLIHMAGEQFRQLMKGIPHGQISMRM
jgi:Ala-tRNA(Pro) deacylase